MKFKIPSSPQVSTALSHLALSVMATLLASCGAPGGGSEDQSPAVPDEGAEADGPVVGGGDGKADSAGALPAFAGLPAGADLGADLQVLFSPDDPTVTLELSLLDRVRTARKQDAGSYPEGHNPFRVRYAVYNLSSPVLLERLALCERDGVDVQILIEADQLGHSWNQVDDFLVGQGLELVADARTLTEQTRKTADLVGIKEEGLMHLKTRLFETPEGTVLLTGSMNPNEGAVVNEESLHLITEPILVERYSQAYDHVLRGLPLESTWDDAAAVNVIFTPESKGPRAVDKVLRWIAEEDEQILLMVFSLRDLSGPGSAESLVPLLGRKVREGVPVYVITDRKQSDGVNVDNKLEFQDDFTDDKLRAAGVPVYEAINDATRLTGRNPFAAMHQKVAILGRSRVRVITDAANWTGAAMGNRRGPGRNVESVLFVDSERLDGGLTGRRYLAQWLRVFERYAPLSVTLEKMEPAADVAARLMGAADWPTQETEFRANPVETRWGEKAYVVGDLPVLGAWGDAGPGLALETDTDHYPEWWSAPVSVPLGRRFEWKLTARTESGEVRWEPGENHVGVAVPPALMPEDAAAVQSGGWR